MLKTTRLALILGLTMGTLMAVPVMAAPPKEKTTDKKANLKITSFDEYIKILSKGKDKWTPQELQDLREYAFAREKHGHKLAAPPARDLIRKKLPKALPLYPQDTPFPFSLTPDQIKIAHQKQEAIWEQVNKESGGRLTMDELKITYEAEIIYYKKMAPYYAPAYLLTSGELKQRGWTKENTDAIELPKRALEMEDAKIAIARRPSVPTKLSEKTNSD